MLDMLVSHGIRADIANNGEEAVAMVGKREYSAVLMDCRMPVMDGYEATRIIRANPRFADLPIIAMTANVMAEEREHCIASGMNDYIGKPIEREKLFQISDAVGQTGCSGRGQRKSHRIRTEVSGIDRR